MVQNQKKKEIRSKIKSRLDGIIFGIKYFLLPNLIKNGNNEQIKKINFKRNNKRNNKRQESLINDNKHKKNNNIILDNQNNKKSKKKTKNKNNIINERKNDFNLNIKNVNKNYKYIFKNNENTKNKKTKKFKKSKKKGQEKDSKRNTITQNSANNEQKEIEKVKNIMEYIDDEKNELEYELAIEYDKRTYCEYYISLLKTKHNFINSFFYNNDYNSKIIKIDIFILGFVIDYTANALFFDDNSMHKIYESKGLFSLEYEITKILYSSLITMGLNTILK